MGQPPARFNGGRPLFSRTEDDLIKEMEVNPLTTGGHIYWLSNRTTKQFAIPNGRPGLSQPSGISAAIPATIQRLSLIPFRVILGMILLAALGICLTVIHRSRPQLPTC